MRDVIEELRYEHGTFTALLAVIELEVEVFEEGGRPDFAAVGNVLRYMLTYPDLVHHPVEAAMAARLRAAAPAVAARIGDIAAEHARLGERARRFKAAIENADRGAASSCDWFAATARHYAAAFRWQMAMEEAVLFPAARRHLGTAEWRRIALARPRGCGLAWQVETAVEPEPPLRWARLGVLAGT